MSSASDEVRPFKAAWKPYAIASPNETNTRLLRSLDRATIYHHSTQNVETDIGLRQSTQMNVSEETRSFKVAWKSDVLKGTVLMSQDPDEKNFFIRD